MHQSAGLIGGGGPWADPPNPAPMNSGVGTWRRARPFAGMLAQPPLLRFLTSDNVRPAVVR